MSGLEQYADTYQILEKLGEGSGGIVYKAYHKRLRTEVVLKKMRNKNISRMMKRQEVDILKNLNHSFLPQVFDFLTVGEDVYTVMSYIPGKSFQELMKSGVKFTQNQLIRWGMQLCSALNYLHSQNPPVIHSDIKPANIMLKPDGNICLIDFNISFFLDGSTVLGYSQGYTSPEQYILALDRQSNVPVKNYRSVDKKTDIYSVGATFYYLATGVRREDFKAPVDQGLLEACTSEAFAQVIIRAMQIDPEKRFSNAYEMFQAFQGITKRDERYRSLLRKQRGIRAALVLFMAGFIVLGGVGIHEMYVERVEAYNDVVEEQIELREEEDYEEAEERYEEATQLLPGALESYYQNAYTLYQQEAYEECVEFIDYDILENEKLDLKDSRMAEVYYLKADSLFRLENFEDAVKAYEKLFKRGGYDTLYYRDYAITLAYNGDKEKAEEVLEEAIEYGLEEDSIFYAKGEIEKALEEYDAALSDFKECIAISEDDALKARAYTLCSKIYETTGDREQERQFLEEAMRELPSENQMLLIERLIQVNLDLADSTGESYYREEAIHGLLTVIDQGWDTYETYDNLAILYEKQEDLNEAEEILLEMQSKFGDDYNIFKRYAFLEIDRQELLANRSRDYAMFEEYYDKAMELYDEESGEDMEMELLMNIYEQVKAGGWL